MSQPVTEDMISALIDGELSPADQIMVENAIATDESLRQVHARYLEAAERVRESARYVQSSISLPVDFTQRVMARVMSPGAESAAPEPPASFAADTSVSQVSREKGKLVAGAGNQAWSRRTWFEILAATAALVVIALVWQGGRNVPEDGKSLAESQQSESQQSERQQSESEDSGAGRSEVQAMGLPDGDESAIADVATGETKGAANGNRANSPGVSSRRTSREFSVFIDAAARPSVDRFWIMNDYEVTAPEGTSPQGDGGPVNVLLVDARKADVLRFLSQLPEWDPDYRLFQHTQVGVASWLAPVDVSQVQEAEGDYWQLQIVLLQR